MEFAWFCVKGEILKSWGDCWSWAGGCICIVCGCILVDPCDKGGNENVDGGKTCCCGGRFGDCGTGDVCKDVFSCGGTICIGLLLSVAIDVASEVSGGIIGPVRLYCAVSGLNGRSGEGVKEVVGNCGGGGVIVPTESEENCFSIKT